MDKKEALEKYLGVEVTENDYGSFETEDGEEWRVYDEDEANQAVKEDIENFIDGVGITGFTPEFRDWIYENAIDEDFFYDAVKEDIESYVYDISDDTERMLEEAKQFDLLGEDATEEDLYDGIDEDLVEKMLDDIDDYADYIKSNFGDGFFNDFVNKNASIDTDAVAEEAIDWDGRGHYLAGYDGKEIELDDGNGYIEYYAYRWN